MKVRSVAFIFVVLVGLTGWLIWQNNTMPRTGAQQVPPLTPVSVKPGTVSERTLFLGTAESNLLEASEARKRSRNLGRARQLLAQLQLLQKVDSIENLQAAAEVEIEFNELLDSGAAALFVREMPADFVGTWFGDLALRRWATEDRRAAAEWMKQHPSDSPVAATALAHDWVIKDPDGLRAYIDHLPAGSWKHNIIKSAGEEALVADKPVTTIELLNRIAGEDARRDELYDWTVTKWAMSDPVRALEWAAKVGDPVLREKLLAAASVGYANVEPEHAAQWAATTTPCPESALICIVRIWAAKDPEPAARWVQQFPGGPARDKLLEGLMAIWASTDAKKAGEWQRTLPDPAMREQAGQLLARVSAETRLPPAN